MVVQDEAADNGDVSLFGADAIMAQPDRGANFIEELGHKGKSSTLAERCEKTGWMINQEGGKSQLYTPLRKVWTYRLFPSKSLTR